MNDNLLYLAAPTPCMGCGIPVEGDRTMCNECVDSALERARFSKIEEAVSKACGVIEKRGLAEVIDIHR